MAPDNTYPTFAEAEAQVRARSRLAGRWVSDRPVEEEIREIYAARTGGREVDLWGRALWPFSGGNGRRIAGVRRRKSTMSRTK